MVFGLFGKSSPQPQAEPRGFDWNAPILRESIIDTIFNGAVAIADKAGNAALNFANDVADGAIGVVGAAFGRVSSVALGSVMTPEPAVAQVRAPEIALPSRGLHDVGRDELFTFSAPTFNAKPLEARATGKGTLV